MDAVWDEHFGYLSTDAAVVVGEWGGIYQDKDRMWQDRFAAYLLAHKLSSFYWSLNPNSGDTGGLLGSDWSTPESAKLQLLSRLHATPLRPLLVGRPAFRCLPTPLAQHLRCADSDENECVLTAHRCNGFYECTDRSDEAGCDRSQLPCLTVSGDDAGRECKLPFNYNGFPYSTCTLVDAFESFSHVGEGRCAAGVLPAVMLQHASRDDCYQACAVRRSCRLFSVSATGQCSGFSRACADAPLSVTAGGWHTYAVMEGGGA
eukprot:3554081-Pleurochrysis_carterae.AAC.1